MPKVRVFLLTWVSLMVLAMGVEAQTAPVINSITPSSAVPGTVVTITGTGFGASQGLSGTLAFGGVPASQRVTATSWSAQKIVVTVPSGAVTGNVVVTVAGKASNSMPLTVTPVITGVSPSSAVEGKLVSITGKGFGVSALAGNSTISFNGVVATPSTWTSSSISVPVPSGVTAGNISLTVAGQASTASPSGVAMFTPTPVINAISPPTAMAGATVTISGSSFGATQGTSTISFSGVGAAVTSWSDTGIVATVPVTATNGPVVVAVNGVSSSGVTFTLTPAISSIAPNPGLVGSTVTITGSNFGSSQGSNAVMFNGATAAVTGWGNSSITATVPSNVTPGNVVVTVNGVVSNGVPFALPPPYHFTVEYAPNGDVLNAKDSVNGNWTYSYDDLNRLATATNTNPQQGFSYAYDQYGNRWQQNVTAGTGNSSQLTFNGSVSAVRNGNCLHRSGMTNQPDGYCYDAAGNLLNDGEHSYSYDGENRIVAVDGGAVTYDYGGDGQRIRKTTGSGSVEYLYDLAGRVVTELSGTGNWNRSEIYAGTRHIGTYGNGTTYFEQTDWLGTERARVLPSGDLYETCTSLPFGDGLHCTGASDPSPKHLTGKARDTESGLDYFGARYYVSSLGRFDTADWATKPSAVAYATFGSPQSLNLYSFVQNNPLTAIDPDGHRVEFTNHQQRAKDLLLRNLSPAERKLFTLAKNKETGKYELRIKKNAVESFKGQHTQAFSRLQTAVDDKHTISISIQSSYNLGGFPQDIAYGSGGGQTIQRRDGNVDVMLAPKGNTQNGGAGVLGANGGWVLDPKSMIAAHEILGHAVEDITGGNTEESHVREIENEFRKEQGLPARDIVHDSPER
ncbi:MAG: repeat-associated core domain protein [Candidatus Sulfotelmatobacter sp.]|nr:repeat-associated core domain protein [Candidatus Sulfotelmatobacter sp.]